MPLVRKEQLDHNTFLGVWRIRESPEELIAPQSLTIPEELFFSGIRNETRKNHWLSYRLMLREFPGVTGPITYDDYGRPSLPVSGHMISITHSGDYSAIIISKDHKVGIDIEHIRNRIERVKERFLSKKELDDVRGDDELKKLYVCWGIKESIYKVHGRPEIEFSQDIAIDPFDYKGTGTCTAVLTLFGQQQVFEMRYEEMDGYMLVYTWKTK